MGVPADVSDTYLPPYEIAYAVEHTSAYKAYQVAYALPADAAQLTDGCLDCAALAVACYLDACLQESKLNELITNYTQRDMAQKGIR